jgi:hypothetical protein
VARNRRTHISFPVYKYRITVIQARDLVATGHAIANRYNVTVELAGCAACFVQHPKKALRCWLLFELDATESTIAHEASHAVTAMFRAVNQRRDEEAFAYHLGHLVHRLHKFLKRSAN